MTIKILNEDLRIRPSAIDGFYGCAWQWGKTFLEGAKSIPSSRAAIGTAIHAAAEAAWTESIAKKDKVTNLSYMLDAGMEAWKDEAAKGMQYNDGEDENTCAAEIIAGTQTFIDDIVPFSAIPVATEQFFKVDLSHSLVSELGGTVDYITDNTIADLKTGKRKPTVSSYSTQQSIYKYLAQANGVDVKHNLIQSVVLKKSPEGLILPMETNVDQAKASVNMLLDTLDVVVKDVAPIETILRPNNRYMFCSKKFCAFYGKCPGTSTTEMRPTQVQVKL